MHRIFNSNVLVLILILLISSCEMPYFDRYPGKALKEVPEDFRGNWVSYTISFEGDEITYKDTTIYTIRNDGWLVGADKKDMGVLSDSIVLSKYKNYYFLSFRNEEGWYCTVIQKKGNQFTMGIVMADKDDSGILEKYFSDVTVVKKKNGSVDYHKIKMKEQELIKFFNKYLLKKFYLKFEVK